MQDSLSTVLLSTCYNSCITAVNAVLRVWCCYWVQLHNILGTSVAHLRSSGKARQGKARQGKARQGKARQGKARPGKARRGKARRGEAGQGKAGQGRA